MVDHKICFYEEIWPIIPKLSLIPFLIWSSVCDFLFASLDNVVLSKIGSAIKGKNLL